MAGQVNENPTDGSAVTNNPKATEDAPVAGDGNAAESGAVTVDGKTAGGAAAPDDGKAVESEATTDSIRVVTGAAAEDRRKAVDIEPSSEASKSADSGSLANGGNTSSGAGKIEEGEAARNRLPKDENKIREAIISQLQKLEDDTDLTAASDFRVAQNWESINSTLGLSAVAVSGIVTIFGAAASVKGMEGWQPTFTFGSTILASAATVIGSVLTFLKPSERAGRYREFGNKQKALRNRIRIYRSVIMSQDGSLSTPTDKLVEFATEKDALNSDNPPIPRSAFLKASKEVLEKRERRTRLDRA
jgi:hypothetical protein